MNQTNIDALIAQAVKAKPRQFLTEKILRSVLIQESGLVSTFERSDKQYRANMQKAMQITGKPEAELLELVTRSDGKIAKFRCEPSIWNSARVSKIAYPARFYYSCSWGLGQVLGVNLMGKSSPANARSTILGFSLNEPYQCLYAANSFEQALVGAYLSPSITKKDIKSLVFYSYVRYNSGTYLSKDLSAQKRAQEVVSRL